MKTLKLSGRTALQIRALQAFGFDLTNIKQTSAYVHGYATWAEFGEAVQARRVWLMEEAFLSERLPVLAAWEADAPPATAQRGLLTASASVVRYAAKRAETQAEDDALAAQKEAKAQGERAIAKARKAEEAKAERRANGNSCECGCGGTTGGGRFLPGHDAKLKSALVNRALNGNDDAVADLEARGWSKFLDKARERKARPAAEVRQAKIEDDQERARHKMAQLQLLKDAAAVLKEQGRYRKSDPGYVQVTMDNAQAIIDGEV